MATLLPLVLTPATTMPRGSTTCTLPRRRPAVRRLARELSASLPILPYTMSEWTKTVADVKREYLNHRYRPCAARCCEILDHIRDADAVEPAYLIYLHFYAASAQEMQARGLNHSPVWRTTLLQQAREHYTRASELIKTADAKALNPSGGGSACPSLHSPTSSVSSQASTASSASTIVSPATPISSLKSPSSVPKRKKRVTFIDTKRASLIDTPLEPIIRPDSPTLGLNDDWSGRSSPELIDAMPLPPTFSPAHLATAFTAHKQAAELPLEPETDIGSEDPFLRARSIHRYCTILTSLQHQISCHLSSIEDELNPSSPTAVTAPLDEETRQREFQARIERLRANGWQRRRFDAQRYEALREGALADLA
ncbi:Fc.00g112750.m01.CDS01 [Cosmosporella sp. VM-42]